MIRSQVGERVLMFVSEKGHILEKDGKIGLFLKRSRHQSNY
jgi:hypothetical protein